MGITKQTEDYEDSAIGEEWWLSGRAGRTTLSSTQSFPLSLFLAAKYPLTADPRTVLLSSCRVM